MQIQVTKRDGSKEPFNANRINKSIERACDGLDDRVGKVVQIATETRLMLYDGITTEELDQATINRYMKRMTDESYDVGIIEGRKDFLRNLVAYNVVMEGIWFYSGFMVMLSFRQRNKLRNFGSMINWVLRDESLYLKFGMQLILSLLEENAELVSPEFAAEIRAIILEGVELETSYNRDLFPNGILGLNADYVNQYV